MNCGIEETIMKLQSQLENTNIDNFYIACLDRSRNLLLLGSFDFSYHHELEVIFQDVSFICCPTEGFIINSFRIACEDEITKLEKVMNDSWEGTIMALEDTTYHKSYYIVAGKIEYNFQLVKYFNEYGKQIEGEMISDWAKEKLSI
jgi:hypothetical protein